MLRSPAPHSTRGCCEPAGGDTLGPRAGIAATGSSLSRRSRRISRRWGSAMARRATSGPRLFQEGLRPARFDEGLEPPHDLAPRVIHRADLARRISREIAHAEFDLGLVVGDRLESPGDDRVLPPGELAETGQGDACVLLERVDAHPERHGRSLELEGRDVTDLRRHRVIRHPEPGLALFRRDRPVYRLRLRRDLDLVDHVAQHRSHLPVFLRNGKDSLTGWQTRHDYEVSEI